MLSLIEVSLVALLVYHFTWSAPPMKVDLLFDFTTLPFDFIWANFTPILTISNYYDDQKVTSNLPLGP